MSKSDKKRIRILCLHGYGTNSTFQKFQMRKWITRLKNIEFIFLDGHIELTKWQVPKELAESLGPSLPPDFEFKSHVESLPIVTPDQPYYLDISHIITYLNNNEPIDGLLTFSQASYISWQFFHQLHKGFLKNKLTITELPYFALFIAGHRGFGQEPIDIPS